MKTLTFPANFDHLDEIREFVGRQARSAGFGEKEIYSIQLAADEAATNVIEHAYAGIANGKIELTCEFGDGRLKISLRDHGASFDPSAIAEPDLKSDLAHRKIGGLGIYIMRKLMDEIHYETTPRGNLLIMVKRKG